MVEQAFLTVLVLCLGKLLHIGEPSLPVEATGVGVLDVVLPVFLDARIGPPQVFTRLPPFDLYSCTAQARRISELTLCYAAPNRAARRQDFHRAWAWANDMPSSRSFRNWSNVADTKTASSSAPRLQILSKREKSFQLRRELRITGGRLAVTQKASTIKRTSSYTLATVAKRIMRLDWGTSMRKVRRLWSATLAQLAIPPRGWRCRRD